MRKDDKETAPVGGENADGGEINEKSPTDENADGSVAASAESDAASDRSSAATGEPPAAPKNRFVSFITGYGGAIGVAVALLLVAALVLIAVLLDGDLYDKGAFFWVLAFLAELGYYMLAKKSRGTLIAMIVTGALAAVFVVLYGLELGGILP